MNVYVDSSALLRVVLGERGVIRQWSTIKRPVASELIRLECFRTIDRARIRFQLADRDVARHRTAVTEQLSGFDLVRIDASVLARAAEPFPTVVGSLDAIHLATIHFLREHGQRVALASYDVRLNKAARSLRIPIYGL